MSTPTPSALARIRERIGLATEAARRAGNYLANAPHRPIAPTADAVAALDVFRRPLQDAPIPAREVLAELDAFGSPATVVTTHGRYFGFVVGGTEPAAHAAAILATTWDQNVGSFTHVAHRRHARRGRVRLDRLTSLGMPAGAVAAFTSGATVANLTGIITARDALYERLGWDVGFDSGIAGAPALRVIVGDEVHISALKALRLAGFGDAQIERVPTDANGAIIADAFPTDTDDHTLVLLQAGNVNTGAATRSPTSFPACASAVAGFTLTARLGCGRLPRLPDATSSRASNSPTRGPQTPTSGSTCPMTRG